MKGRNHLEELDADGRIILEWILNSVKEHGLDSSGSRTSGWFL
jgi:hypothetical protein